VRLAEVEMSLRTGRAAAARERAKQLIRSIRKDDVLASRIYLRAGQISHLDDRLEEAVELFKVAEEQATTPPEKRKALLSRFVSLTDLDDPIGADRALAALEDLPHVGVEDLLRARQARFQ